MSFTMSRSAATVLFLLIVISTLNLQVRAIDVHGQESNVLHLRFRGSHSLSSSTLDLEDAVEDIHSALFSTNRTGFIATKYDELPRWLQIVLCVAGIVVGLVQTFAGYKIFRTSIFLVTGSIFGLVAYTAIDAIISDSNELKAAYVYGTALVVGVFVGLIFVWCIRPAIFVMGAAVGVFLAIFLNPIALRFIWPSNPEANLYIWMAVFGLVFGLAVLCLERVLMIVATALGGAFMVTVSVGTLIHNLPSLTTEFANPDSVPTVAWIYLGVWAGLFVIGSLVQLFVTAADEDHRLSRGSDNKKQVGGYLA